MAYFLKKVVTATLIGDEIITQGSLLALTALYMRVLCHWAFYSSTLACHHPVGGQYETKSHLRNRISRDFSELLSLQPQWKQHGQWDKAMQWPLRVCQKNGECFTVQLK